MGKLTRTKSDQSVDESWTTGITTGSIRCLKSKFESEDEFNFELQTPAADSTGEATILDEDEATEVGEAIDEAVVVLEEERNSGSNESTQGSGNDEKKTKLERKAEKERKKQEK